MKLDFTERFGICKLLLLRLCPTRIIQSISPKYREFSHVPIVPDSMIRSQTKAPHGDKRCNRILSHFIGLLFHLRSPPLYL